MEALPPLDRPVAWVVVRGYEQAGPYTLDVLIDEVVAGRLAGSTPVWWPPLTDWTTIMACDALMGEVERRRSGGAPGWAPPTVVTGRDDIPDVGHTGDVGSGPDVEASTGYGPSSSGTRTGEQPDARSGADDGIAAVEVVDPRVVELEPTPEADPADDDPEIVDAVLAAPASKVDVVDGRFATLVDRSAHLAAGLKALADVDETFVSTMVRVADARGLVMTDRHSGSGEHRVHLRDVSGDHELTVLIGRVTGGPADTSIRPLVTLSVALSVRGGVSSVDGAVAVRGDGAQHGAIDIRSDGQGGRTLACVELYLGVADYVDENLVVDTDRLDLDLGSIIDSLDAALTH